MDDNIPHTPSHVGVVTSTTFSHTPEEAMSVGLAKACVLLKNWFCFREKLNLALKIKQNEKSTCLHERGVWSEKYISVVTVGKIRKEDGRLQEPSKVLYKVS